MIGIINYGVGNLQSMKNSLDYLGIPNTIVSKPNGINECDKIILPGVGAFGPAMDKLNALGFSEKIKEFASLKKPLLGICLGMQLLFEESEEYGEHKGLCLLKGNVLPFSKKVRKLPTPHVGWNTIQKNQASPILKDIENQSSFYFVHSFYCNPKDLNIVLAQTNYGIDFASVVGKDNIMGCQFHPEKSQTAGLKLLKNFQNL